MCVQPSTVVNCYCWIVVLISDQDCDSDNRQLLRMCNSEGDVKQLHLQILMDLDVRALNYLQMLRGRSELKSGPIV